MRKKLIGLTLVFAIIMSLIFIIPTASYATTRGTCGDNLTWTLEDGKLTISGYGDMTDWDSFLLPPWYEYLSNINSVEFLDGVTSIGNLAFNSFYNLNNIIIPNSVKRIGDAAFAGCEKLESIAIPASVTNIGYCMFDSCYSLTEIVVDENNKYYSSDSRGVLFNKNKTELIRYPIGNQEVIYNIPDSVTRICELAFFDVNNLSAVIIPGSVEIIENQAFSYCRNLTDVKINNGVKTIAEDAFSCSPINNIVLPNSLTSISDHMLNSCDLSYITIPKSITSIGCGAFNGNPLEDVFYEGSQKDWDNIDIDPDNDSLFNSEIHYKYTTEQHDIIIEVRDAKTNKLIPDSKISVFSDADNAKFHTLSNGKITLKNVSFPIYQIGVNAFGYTYHKSYKNIEYPQNGKIVFYMDVITRPEIVPVEGVEIYRATEELIVGDTYELWSSVSPLNASNKNVSYSSLCPDVITVDNNGNIKAVGIGYSDITVTTEDGGYTDTIQIRVAPPMHESLASFKDIAYKFDNASASKKISLGVYIDVFDRERGIEEYNNDEAHGTKGVCGGIVSTSMMFHNGYRDTNDYGASSIGKLSSRNKKLRNFIAYMFLIQGLGDSAKSKMWNRTAKSDGNQQIDIMVETLTSEILHICVYGKDGASGHSLLAYGMSYNEYDKDGNKCDKMWVYDCNDPKDDDLYIALYKDADGNYNGEWKYGSKYNSQLEGAWITFVQYSAIVSTAEEKDTIHLYSLRNSVDEDAEITFIQNSDILIIENNTSEQTIINNGCCEKNDIDNFFLSYEYYSDNDKYRAIFPNDKYSITSSNDESIIESTVYSSSDSIKWTNINNAEITFDVRDAAAEGADADNYLNINNNSVEGDYSITYMPFASVYGYNYDTITISGNTDGTIKTYEEEGNIYVSGVDKFDVSVVVGNETITATAEDLNAKSVYCAKVETDNGITTIQIVCDNLEITERVMIPERQKASQPSYDVESGEYSEEQTLTLTPDNEMVCLYYTTDGSEPYEDISMLYTEPISINQSMTVNVLATQYGCENSDILTLDYVLPDIAIPVPTLFEGEYTGIQQVELIADDEANIYYTIDGSDPLENGELYTCPIILTEDTTLKTYAEINGCVSEVCEYAYAINAAEECAIDDIFVAEELVKVNISTNENKSGILIVACYDARGALIGMNYCNINLTANILSSKLIDLNTNGSAKVSAFFWENKDGMRPICKSFSKTIE